MKTAILDSNLPQVSPETLEVHEEKDPDWPIKQGLLPF